MGGVIVLLAFFMSCIRHDCVKILGIMYILLSVPVRFSTGYLVFFLPVFFLCLSESFKKARTF